MVAIAGGIAAAPEPAAAATWESDPAKLCEIAVLDSQVQLTRRQHEAIRPILKQLARDLERWRWRNNGGLCFRGRRCRRRCCYRSRRRLFFRYRQLDFFLVLNLRRYRDFLDTWCPFIIRAF